MTSVFVASSRCRNNVERVACVVCPPETVTPPSTDLIKYKPGLALAALAIGPVLRQFPLVVSTPLTVVHRLVSRLPIPRTVIPRPSALLAPVRGSLAGKQCPILHTVHNPYTLSTVTNFGSHVVLARINHDTALPDSRNGWRWSCVASSLVVFLYVSHTRARCATLRPLSAHKRSQ